MIIIEKLILTPILYDTTLILIFDLHRYSRITSKMAAAAVQDNNNNIARENMIVYLSPNAVHRMFTVIMEYQPFENECINQNVLQRMLQPGNNDILISNQEYIWHLYIRYLCCNGRLNSMFNMLEHIRQDLNEDANRFNVDSIEMFLNRVDVPGFEGNTILDTFIMWNNDDIAVERLYEFGAVTHITLDNITNIIHHRHWTNPFVNIMRIPGFPSFVRNRIIQQQDIMALINQGERIHNNAAITRHISHYYNTIVGIIHGNNRDPDGIHENEEERLNQIIINNPDINNEHIQNNNIVIA